MLAIVCGLDVSAKRQSEVRQLEKLKFHSGEILFPEIYETFYFTLLLQIDRYFINLKPKFTL